MYKWLSALVISVCFSCASKLYVVPSNTTEGKLAFYSFYFWQDSVSRQTHGKLTGVQVVDAPLHWDDNKKASQLPDYLQLEITDKSHHVINLFSAHPLKQRVDVFSPPGDIESKLVSLQTAEVVLRVPFYSAYRSIKITEYRDGKVASTFILK